MIYARQCVLDFVYRSSVCLSSRGDFENFQPPGLLVKNKANTPIARAETIPVRNTLKRLQLIVLETRFGGHATNNIQNILCPFLRNRRQTLDRRFGVYCFHDIIFANSECNSSENFPNSEGRTRWVRPKRLPEVFLPRSW